MAEAVAHTIQEDVHHAHADHHELSFFRKYIWSEDHKTIALQYLFTSMAFLLVGGLLAMGVRFQLAFPNAPIPVIGTLLPSWLVTSTGAIQPGGYNGLVTMHATVMVFLVIMQFLIGVFGNFLIPLKIGAPDMAFPFFNALSYWLFLLSGIVLLSSFLVPAGFPASGWTSYAPLSSHALYNGTQFGQSLWCVGLPDDHQLHVLDGRGAAVVAHATAPRDNVVEFPLGAVCVVRIRRFTRWDS
jgi:cytochrome c oxidase subunit I